MIDLFKPIDYRKRSKFELWAFDTEDENGEIIQAVFTNGTQYKVFHRKEYGEAFNVRAAAMKFLYNLSKRKDVRIAAVNMEYDICNIAFPEFMRPDIWEIEQIKGRWLFARLRGTNVTLFDVMNHSKESVSSWGKLLGKRKLKFNPKSIRYCKRDAEITYLAALFLRKLYENEGGSLKLTSPSSALEIYRARFMTRNFYRVDDDNLEFFRKGYYGGRVEIFHYGYVRGAIKSCDTVSMYPYCMTNPLPNYDCVNHGTKIPGDYDYIADVTVKVPKMNIPPLPYRYENKLIFPIGSFRGVYTSPELEFARSLGVQIVKIHKCLSFPSSEPYLSDYAKHFFNCKQNAKTVAMKTFYKLLLNSLYGKFGTSGNIETFAFVDNDETLGYTFTEDDDRELPIYANVIWSAFITAYARVHLLQHLLKVERPLYCDTDSIIFIGESDFEMGNELGQFKLEGNYVSGKFILPKTYFLTEKDGNRYIRAKGIPFAFRDKFIQDLYIEFTKPLRYREAIRRGDRPNRWIKAHKSIDSGYTKRIILSKGLTEPIALKGGVLQWRKKLG